MITIENKLNSVVKVLNVSATSYTGASLRVKANNETIAYDCVVVNATADATTGAITNGSITASNVDTTLEGSYRMEFVGELATTGGITKLETLGSTYIKKEVPVTSIVI